MKCPECGTEVPKKEPTQYGRQRTYCSDKCRARAHHRRYNADGRRRR